jgi:xanthine dehydrogenase YagS FAD-binding subunit
MSAQRFSYAAASALDEVLEILAADCRPLAGGVDLLDRIKEGLIAPPRLVGLRQVQELAQVRADAGGVHVGAMTSLASLASHPTVAESGPEWACLRQALAATASPQIRNMATVGGNLLQRPRCWYLRNKLTHCLRKGGRRCFAFRGENERHAILGGGPCYIVHPSDLAVALLALEASVTIASPGGRRSVPLAELYLLPKVDAQREAAIDVGELLVEVLVPGPAASSRGLYLKVAERGERDFALASVAIQASLDQGIVQGIRMALGGVAPVPWRAAEAENALLGQRLTEANIRSASLAATTGARPLAQNAYKVELVQGLVREALRGIV